MSKPRRVRKYCKTLASFLEHIENRGRRMFSAMREHAKGPSVYEMMRQVRGGRS